MLHLVCHSPARTRDLDDCLAVLGGEDHLLLLQDAVIATTLPAWQPRLAGLHGRVHVLAEDLLARGLTPSAGHVIDMPGFVDLVVEHGSPLRWA